MNNPNWNHLGENAMATNTDETYGGIIDVNLASGNWFVIPNHPGLNVMSGFASKTDAFVGLDSAIREAGLACLEFPA